VVTISVYKTASRVRWRQNWRQWLSDHSIIGAVVNLRFTLLLALLVFAGLVAVLVLSFACVIICFMWYVVTMSAPNVRKKLSVFSWRTALWRTLC
jgi:hypothetical protein